MRHIDISCKVLKSIVSLEKPALGTSQRIATGACKKDDNLKIEQIILESI